MQRGLVRGNFKKLSYAGESMSAKPSISDSGARGKWKGTDKIQWRTDVRTSFFIKVRMSINPLNTV